MHSIPKNSGREQLDEQLCCHCTSHNSCAVVVSAMTLPNFTENASSVHRQVLLGLHTVFRPVTLLQKLTRNDSSARGQVQVGLHGHAGAGTHAAGELPGD